MLQTGALPVEFETVERTDVSATLGADSLREARNAAIAGLVLVAVFLLAVYRFLGLVAVLGLAVYAALIYGAILLLGVTLTLPGFAGPDPDDRRRRRRERRHLRAHQGRGARRQSVRSAIATGYAKGLRTILDANAVTCITALVLFAVASASVKGFALMLLVGTVVSLATAVAATRAMLGLLAGFMVRQPALHGRDRRRRSRAGSAGTSSAAAGSGSCSPWRRSRRAWSRSRCRA